MFHDPVEMEILAQRMREATNDPVPRLLRHAMANVVQTGADHQVECYLCETHMYEECDVWANAAVLMVAWSIHHD